MRLADGASDCLLTLYVRASGLEVRMRSKCQLPCVLLMALCTVSTGAAQPPAPRAVRVPVAPPHIMILEEGEPEPVWREPPVAPENEIVLTGLGAQPPADVRAAVAALRAALPRDWLDGLMRDFGYVPNRGRRATASRRTDLREHDLARFLFDRWVVAAPETRLAREFSCISPGEFDISVFLTLLVEEHRGYPENPGGWNFPRGARGERLAWTASNNARAAWWSCTRLVRAVGSVRR